mmetsp:Transcript_5999/g.19581  ORF Transcript_5999/g.19581 Transcript_5999/m.19581 type:complete len:274 (+) Transcript_5999:4349-5170(+)
MRISPSFCLKMTLPRGDREGVRAPPSTIGPGTDKREPRDGLPLVELPPPTVPRRTTARSPPAVPPDPCSVATSSASTSVALPGVLARRASVRAGRTSVPTLATSVEVKTPPKSFLMDWVKSAGAAAVKTMPMTAESFLAAVAVPVETRVSGGAAALGVVFFLRSDEKMEDFLAFFGRSASVDSCSSSTASTTSPLIGIANVTIAFAVDPVNGCGGWLLKANSVDPIRAKNVGFLLKFTRKVPVRPTSSSSEIADREIRALLRDIRTAENQKNR